MLLGNGCYGSTEALGHMVSHVVAFTFSVLSADDTSLSCFKGLFRIVFASRDQQQPDVALLRLLPVCVKIKHTKSYWDTIIELSQLVLHNISFSLNLLFVHAALSAFSPPGVTKSPYKATQI